MRNSEKLKELLMTLPDSEKTSFEYILNFYTEEHVFCNFDELREEIKYIDLSPCANFKKPLERNLKELADNIDLPILLNNFLSFTQEIQFETETKSVSDFLLYLTDYTEIEDSVKLERITSLNKYKDLIDMGYISADSILGKMRSFFGEKTKDQEDIDWKALDADFNIELEKEIKWNTILLKNLNDERPRLSSITSADLIYAIRNIDFDEAFSMQSGIITNDVSIVLLKYIAGEEFKNLNHESIEYFKSILKTFDLKVIKDSDIELIKSNFDTIKKKSFKVEDIYFIKNVAVNKDSLEAFRNLPSDLQKQVLKLNIVANEKEIGAVLKALSYCKEEKEEEIKDNFFDVKRYFSDLPEEKREQLVELMKQENFKDYKKKLDLKYDFTFGFELEAVGISDITMKKILQDEDIEKAIREKQKIENGITHEWIIEYDGTVPTGLEVVSPIITDCEEDWQSLKEVCKFMQSVGATVDGTCGGHIHIGADVLGLDGKAWENFFKLWASAEPIIYKMSNKPGEKPRFTTIKQCGPTKPILEEMLSHGSIELKNHDDVIKMADYYTRRGLKGHVFPGRIKGMNLGAIAEKKQDTIEFRAPNGNLDFIEIQRTAELYARMMEVSAVMATNPEYKKDLFEKVQNTENEKEKMIYFIDLLFDKTIDKAVFYERYFSYTGDLVLSGRPYKTITNTEIDIDKKAKYEYRGDR